MRGLSHFFLGSSSFFYFCLAFLTSLTWKLSQPPFLMLMLLCWGMDLCGLLECPPPLLSRPLLLDLSSSVPTPPPGVTERSGLPSAKGCSDLDWRISIRSESSHTACLKIAAARRACPASAWNPPIKDPHLRHARHAWQLQDSLSSTGERPPITQSPSCGCKKGWLPFIFIDGGVFPYIRIYIYIYMIIYG